MMFRQVVTTARMTAGAITSGGVIYLMPAYLLRLFYLLPLLLLWRTLMGGGVEVGMSLDQMLAYTFLGTVFSAQLVVRTPASDWLYEGLIISLYQRPMGVFAHLAAQTVGAWLPELLFFSLPMLVAAPLLGVRWTAGVLAWAAIPSLLLCVSLGFAVDFLFASASIRLKNASWLVYSIRAAMIALLSGSVIPFAILPFGLGRLLALLPFGSLAAAPLSLFVGLADAVPTLSLQLAWNVVLWPAAVLVFGWSQERMVSHGG